MWVWRSCPPWKQGNACSPPCSAEHEEGPKVWGMKGFAAVPSGITVKVSKSAQSLIKQKCSEFPDGGAGLPVWSRGSALAYSHFISLITFAKNSSSNLTWFHWKSGLQMFLFPVFQPLWSVFSPPSPWRCFLCTRWRANPPARKVWVTFLT